MSKIPVFTKEQLDSVAHSIEDGSYFKESRKFYSIIYMSIMPERCLFIVMTALASLTAFLALIAVASLMPLRPATPLLFPMQNVTRDIPIIIPLRNSPYQPVNEALQTYFVREYVNKRERYDFETIQASFRFLKRYSEDSVMNGYRRYIDPGSPRSPINRYEKRATRDIDIIKTTIIRADGEQGEEDYSEPRTYIADVTFKARVINAAKIEFSYWQAQLAFDYTPLKTTQPDDLVKGKLKIAPMAFSVTDYTVFEVPAPKEEP
jgi:type IV secretory pathway component VirB8